MGLVEPSLLARMILFRYYMYVRPQAARHTQARPTSAGVAALVGTGRVCRFAGTVVAQAPSRPVARVSTMTPTGMPHARATVVSPVSETTSWNYLPVGERRPLDSNSIGRY